MSSFPIELSLYKVPGIDLGTGNTKINKTQFLAWWSSHAICELVGNFTNKEAKPECLSNRPKVTQPAVV